MNISTACITVRLPVHELIAMLGARGGCGGKMAFQLFQVRKSVDAVLDTFQPCEWQQHWMFLTRHLDDLCLYLWQPNRI